MREVRFRPSLELYNNVRQKFQTALNAVAGGDPEKAPRDFTLGSSKCAFCPYSKQCWQTDSKKAYFKTFPPKKWPVDVDLALSPLFEQYEAGLKEQDKLEQVEAEIVKQLVAAGIEKARLPNGHIYVVKELQSPYRRMVLRKGKL